MLRRRRFSGSPQAGGPRPSVSRERDPRVPAARPRTPCTETRWYECRIRPLSAGTQRRELPRAAPGSTFYHALQPWRRAAERGRRLKLRECARAQQRGTIRARSPLNPRCSLSFYLASVHLDTTRRGVDTGARRRQTVGNATGLGASPQPPGFRLLSKSAVGQGPRQDDHVALDKHAAELPLPDVWGAGGSESEGPV